MVRVSLDVRSNGMVIFDPAALIRHYGGITAGTNLFERYTTTDEGDDVITKGLIIPVLGILNTPKTLIFKTHGEPWEFEGDVWLDSEHHPLAIVAGLVVFDLAPLKSWPEDAPWIPVPGFGPGTYRVAIRLYGRESVSDPNRAFGYIIEIEACAELPPLTADLDEFLQH